MNDAYTHAMQVHLCKDNTWGVTYLELVTPPPGMPATMTHEYALDGLPQVGHTATGYVDMSPPSMSSQHLRLQRHIASGFVVTPSLATSSAMTLKYALDRQS
jgi:hypothetical protein